MTQEIRNLLSSTKAGDRKRAVRILSQQGDLQAFKQLAALAKRERDPQVKKAAREAAVALKRQLESGASRKPKTAASRKEMEARALLEQAREQMEAVHYAEAQELAHQAFDRYPALAEDGASRQLVADIFGTSQKEAITILVGTPDDAKRKRKGGDEASWGEALLDVGLYGLVIGTVVFVGCLIIIFGLSETLEAVADSGSLSGQDSQAVQDVIENLDSMGLLLAAGYGVGSAVSGMLGMFVLFGAIHLAATAVLHGRGTFPGLLKAVTVPMLVWFFTNIGVIVGLLVYLFVASGEPGVSGILNTYAFINFLVMLAFWVWLASIIGENYVFGRGYGCISIMLGYILLIAPFCACWFMNLLLAWGQYRSAQTVLILLF